MAYLPSAVTKPTAEGKHAIAVELVTQVSGLLSVSPDESVSAAMAPAHVS